MPIRAEACFQVSNQRIMRINVLLGTAKREPCRREGWGLLDTWNKLNCTVQHSSVRFWSIFDIVVELKREADGRLLTVKIARLAGSMGAIVIRHLRHSVLWTC